MASIPNGGESTRSEAAPIPFRILDLPSEVLSNICEHLEDADLPQVRRGCRALRAHSTTFFGKRFFSHLAAILHPTSLTTLLEIARHKVLAKYVRQVSLSGELLGVHIVPDHDDEAHIQLHMDLQKSVEESGLDRIILREVFRSLGNLKLVRIDSHSFAAFHLYEEYWNPIKCGRHHILGGDSSQTYTNVRENLGFSRVYQLVLRALHSVGLHSEVNLSLVFCNTQDGTTPHFMDVTSRAWIHGFSKTLRAVFYYGSMNVNWMRELLSSASDVHDLGLAEQASLVRLSSYDGKVLYWAGLRRLQLYELVLRHDEFLLFLQHHSRTITALIMQIIGLSGGGWIELLQCIRNMQNLRTLFLNEMLEPTPYGSSADTFDRFDLDIVGTALDFGGHAIPVALAALCSEIRTMPGHVVTLDGVTYAHQVDFRKARAAGKGLIVDVDGDWLSTCSTDDSDSMPDDPVFTSGMEDNGEDSSEPNSEHGDED